MKPPHHSDTPAAHRPAELLSPAGDPQSMQAAIVSGADAVYFGLEDFNARRRAANFSVDNLAETMTLLHDHNVRGYVAMNTLIFPEELPVADGFVRAIADAGADAVIVQDIGLARLIHEMAPQLPLHASTQMTLPSARAIAWAAQCGISRVILPRELSIEQIAAIATAGGVELEVFVHGAMCISYSGQCHASAALGTGSGADARSANRGLCAQPCRLPWRLLVDGKAMDLAGRPHVLSPRDLRAYDLIPRLLAAGVKAFKIEGRLKDANYVAAVTALYRKALDAALAGRAFVADQADVRAQEQSFSRGFTHGYLKGHDPAALVEGRSPKKQGRRCGTVVGDNNGRVRVRVDRGEHLSAGDGVAFDSPGEAEASQQGGRIYAVRLIDREKALVELTFGRGSVDARRVRAGWTVWKTDDPAMEKEIARGFASLAPARRRPLWVEADAAPGRPLIIRLRDVAQPFQAVGPADSQAGKPVPSHGHEAVVTGNAPLEAAVKYPLTIEVLQAQFSRLGNTPYELAGVELRRDSQSVRQVDVMVPVSELNRMRRDAVAILQAAQRQRWGIININALATLRGRAKLCAIDVSPVPGQQHGRDGHATKNSHAGLCVLARTAGQVLAVGQWAAMRKLTPEQVTLYLEAGDEDALSPMLAAAGEAGIRPALVTPQIVAQDDEHLVRAMIKHEPAAVLVRSAGALSLLRELAPQVPLVADSSLNAANELSAAWLLDSGSCRVTASLDLALPQIEAMAAALPPGALEVCVYSRHAMFHSQYCLWSGRIEPAAPGKCRRTCRTHSLALAPATGGLAAGGLNIPGRAMPVVRDAACRSTVYAARASFHRDWAGSLMRCHAGALRAEFLDEDSPEIRRVLDALYSATKADRINDAIRVNE
ncbi:MAG: U32 family peptidase [Planctomycetaceae bacterium]|nr:U32 family peptidase [Planctomycetaceae bacterium]